MSIVRCVTIIGDSNAKRHMNSVNSRDRPTMLEAQVVQCGRMSTFAASLQSIRAESNVCVLSCISNFITSLQEKNPYLCLLSLNPCSKTSWPRRPRPASLARTSPS